MSNDIASVRRVAVDCCCGKSPFSLPNFLLLVRSREGEKTNYTAVSHTRFFHHSTALDSLIPGCSSRRLSLPFSPSVTLSHFGVGGGGDDGGNKPRGYFLRPHTISSARLTKEIMFRV